MFPMYTTDTANLNLSKVPKLPFCKCWLPAFRRRKPSLASTTSGTTLPEASLIWVEYCGTLDIKCVETVGCMIFIIAGLAALPHESKKNRKQTWALLHTHANSHHAFQGTLCRRGCCWRHPPRVIHRLWLCSRRLAGGAALNGKRQKSCGRANCITIKKLDNTIPEWWAKNLCVSNPALGGSDCHVTYYVWRDDENDDLTKLDHTLNDLKCDVQNKMFVRHHSIFLHLGRLTAPIPGMTCCCGHRFWIFDHHPRV